MPSHSRTLSVHHGIKAVILLGFAAYITHLVESERILLYIAPRMVVYVKWSAIFLYAVALQQVYAAVQAWRSPYAQVDCDCGHDHGPSGSVFKNIVVYSLFIFPLLLGFVLPDAALGGSIADKKGMNLNSSGSFKTGSENRDSSQAGREPAAKTGASLDALFPAEASTKPYAELAKQLYPSHLIQVKEELFLETLTAVDLYLNPFLGKKLQLTGFVYHSKDMAANQFVVGRLSIQCCSADAAPFGVMAEYPGAGALESDSWVTVTGTIGKMNYQDAEIMVLKVEKIQKVQPAKSPYVYPNPDFGSQR